MADSVKHSKLNKVAIAIISVIVLVFIDQWTKGLAVSNLKYGEPFVLLKNVLELAYVENTGAAFGILKNLRWVFMVITPVVCIVLAVGIVRMPSKPRYVPMYIDFIFIISGAIGNFIDRIVNGYVVDFIYFMPIDFPLFNVADSYITCAFAVLLFLIVFYYKEDELSFFSR